ncbi:MAG: ribonuclease J [Candidatus Paceibacterota bacterium]
MNKKTKRGKSFTSKNKKKNNKKVTIKPRKTKATRHSETNISKSDFAKPKKGVVRFVALGGLEEIGRNMMFLEYGDEIIIIDAGLQFPEDETPGVDYIIPNTSYLELKKKNIKGMIITHGHYDHIGAIPHILEKIGNPTIYATELTREIVNKRQGDYPNSPKPIFDLIKPGDTKKISTNFSVKFFAVEHNIPEGVGMIINTPIGKIVHPGEFKLPRDKKGNALNLNIWEDVGKEGVHTLMLDSTASQVPGPSLSEEVVAEELEKLFKKAEARIIVGAFSSVLDRLKEIINIAERLGRVIAISGYSMKTNFEIAKNIGFIKTKKGTVIEMDELKKYKDNQIMILCTGAQGEEKASLMRMANGEHRHVKIKNTDTIILSSSVIPGNEKPVSYLKDNLARQGATIYDYKMLNIHSSGHAPQEDLKTVMSLVKPRFFLPIHGQYFMRWVNTQLAKETLGLEEKNMIMADNGLVVEIEKDKVAVTDEQIPASYVLVDGSGVGDVGEVVLRDRKVLSEEGMMVVIATINRRTKRVTKNPDIISRGFIYLRENQDILNDIRKKVKGIIAKLPNNKPVDADYIKSLMRDQIGSYVYRKTKRKPMILPVVIEV